MRRIKRIYLSTYFKDYRIIGNKSYISTVFMSHMNDVICIASMMNTVNYFNEGIF